MKTSIGITDHLPAFWNFPLVRSVMAKAMRRGRHNIKNALENRYARNRHAGASAVLLRRPEHLRQFVRARNRQLVVTAIGWRFIGPPAHKSCRMPEAVSLQMVVLHFAHEFRT